MTRSLWPLAAGVILIMACGGAGPGTSSSDSAPCTKDALTTGIAAGPGVAEGVDITITKMSCADGYAMAVVSSPGGDTVVTVLQSEGSSWSLLDIGPESGNCPHADLPDETCEELASAVGTSTGSGESTPSKSSSKQGRQTPRRGTRRK